MEGDAMTATQFKEADWKILSHLRKDALERLCQQILSEIASINTNQALSAHQRYLDIFELIQRRDKDIARAFNDHRRSTALSELLAIRSLGLLTPEEFKQFSQETRDTVSRVLQK
jgi:hypothetical protein